MDIHTVRQQLKTRSVYDISLRVTFYTQVSSESESSSTRWTVRRATASSFEN